MPRLTDARSGIALSTRAVFDDMSAPDYLVSMVYFSGSTGAHLAKRWFGAAEAEKFAIDTPGGYYDIGQNGYPKRVASIMDSQHMEYWQATATADHQIIAGIKQHWPGYLVTMLPLTWRGLWIDQFLFPGLPCFLWACRCAVRRRDGLLAVLLGLGRLQHARLRRPQSEHPTLSNDRHALRHPRCRRYPGGPPPNSP